MKTFIKLQELQDDGNNDEVVVANLGGRSLTTLARQGRQVGGTGNYAYFIL